MDRAYDTLKKRIQRNPEQYKTQTVAGEGGGKEQIRVAVSSLSQKARKAHRAAQRIDGGDIIIDQIKGQETPWYEPWVKPIERFFGQVCSNFSKRFDSYTGTLTGSKTDAKRKKDIDKMLERGELLTMEEFYGEWKKWLDKYHNKVHSGLKGDQWHTPIEVFRNATRYTEEAAPARSVTAMLLMKGQTVTVRNYGIQKFGTVYTDSELGKYVGEKVQIKWDQDDVRRLYVFRKDGKSICEAVSAELLAFGDKVSQDALERHLAAQKRNEKEIERILAEFTTPYEMRVEQGRPTDAVGKLDLTIKAHRRDNTIAFPQDRKIREQMAAQRRKKDTAAGEEFLASKGAGVFDQLRAMSG